MEKFKITDAMKKWANENKEGLESNDLLNKRTYGIAFCNTFYYEGFKWDFDTWGNPEDDMFLMYVSDIHWLTVVIDGDIWRDTVEEFLRKVEDAENYIRELQEKVLVYNQKENVWKDTTK